VRILLILTAGFDQGGTQNDMIQLAKALTPLGYRIHLAAPPGILVNTLKEYNVVFHPVPDPVKGIRGLVRYTIALAKVIRSFRFHILAPQSIRSSLAAGLLRKIRLTRVPVVTSLHNLHNPDSSALAALILAHSAEVVTLENHYERRLVGLERTRPGCPTRVIYSGVDLKIFRPGSTSGRVAGLPETSGRLVGCVARFSEEKDHPTLLRAWQLHLKQNPDDHLVLVGDGPERARIEACVARLAIGDSVSLLGERSDVSEILPCLDLFVLSSNRESYPRSAREALACGVPVILPAIGGCGEIVSSPEIGALFQSGDSVDLARKIGKILKGDLTMGERSALARSHAEKNFRLDKWRDAMDSLYRSYNNFSQRAVNSL